MIDVRMGEDHGIDRRGVDGEPLPVLGPQGLRPLEEPTVDEQAGPGVFDQKSRACHRAGGPEKRQLHGFTLLSRRDERTCIRRHGLIP